jgi:hypothetical protein
MNRRQSTRVAVRLGCHVVWPQGSSGTTMLTENISRDGMLLRWEAPHLVLPRVGELLIVEVELPEQEGFERRCIRCQTTVARLHVEPGAAFTWVGLRIHAMDFRTAQAVPVKQLEPAAINGRGGRNF